MFNSCRKLIFPPLSGRVYVDLSGFKQIWNDVRFKWIQLCRVSIKGPIEFGDHLQCVDLHPLGTKDNSFGEWYYQKADDNLEHLTNTTDVLDWFQACCWILFDLNILPYLSCRVFRISTKGIGSNCSGGFGEGKSSGVIFSGPPWWNRHIQEVFDTTF